MEEPIIETLTAPSSRKIDQGYHDLACKVLNLAIDSGDIDFFCSETYIPKLHFQPQCDWAFLMCQLADISILPCIKKAIKNKINNFYNNDLDYASYCLFNADSKLFDKIATEIEIPRLLYKYAEKKQLLEIKKIQLTKKLAEDKKTILSEFQKKEFILDSVFLKEENKILIDDFLLTDYEQLLTANDSEFRDKYIKYCLYNNILSKKQKKIA